MNRADIRRELLSLGHHYLEDEPGRAERFIDQSASEILLSETWPQRTFTSVLAPGDRLATLGIIVQVWDTDSGRLLTPTTAAEIRDRYTATSPDPGEPCEYWVVQNAVILTAPALTGGQTVSVEHASKGVWQSADERYALAPDDNAVLIGDGVFDEAVILGARLRALEDTDETGLRDSITARLETELLGLRFRELNIVADEPQRIQRTQDLA